MKKVLFFCAMLSISSAMLAQKYAVIDANSTLTEACRDAKNIDMRLLQKAWEGIQECMVHEKSKDYYDTWRVAAKIKNVMTVKTMEKGLVSGEDSVAYFNNLQDIMSYNSKLEKCMTTPNEKGKLPVKTDEYKDLHKEALHTNSGLRMNLLSGAYRLINSHPEDAKRYLDTYLDTFTDPLYKELNLDETDSLKENAYLYYGMIYKNKAVTWEDTLEYLKYYEKVLPSELYSNYACVELMNTYKEHGDKENWEKYCKYAIEHFPQDAQFPKLLIQEYVQSERIDAAKEMCDVMIKSHPTEIYPVETKALLFFNDKKYNEAIDVFKKLTELDPTYARAWTSLGTCYYQIAMENRNKIDVCKQYLNQAVPCYKKSEECEPDQPVLWGNYLYRCYHALSDKTNENKYAKYKEE